MKISEDEYVGARLIKWRTPCCKAKAVRHGRADWRCGGCEKDVTLDLVHLDSMYRREYQIKLKKNDALRH